MFKKVSFFLIFILVSTTYVSFDATPVSAFLVKKGKKNILICGDMHTAGFSETLLDQPHIESLQGFVQKQASQKTKTAFLLEAIKDAKKAEMKKAVESSILNRDCLNSLIHSAMPHNYKIGNITFIAADDYRKSEKNLGAILLQVSKYLTKIYSNEQVFIAWLKGQQVHNISYSTIFSEFQASIDAVQKLIPTFSEKTQKYATDTSNATLETFKHYKTDIEQFFKSTYGSDFSVDLPITKIFPKFIQNHTLEILVNKQQDKNPVGSISGVLSEHIGNLGFLVYMQKALEEYDNIVIYIGHAHACFLRNFLELSEYVTIRELGSRNPHAPINKEFVLSNLDTKAFSEILEQAFSLFNQTEEHSSQPSKTAQHLSELAMKVSKTVAVDYLCALCQKTGQDFKRCSRCRGIHYCTPKCQTDHWPIHKTTCKSSKEVTKN